MGIAVKVAVSTGGWQSSRAHGQPGTPSGQAGTPPGRSGYVGRRVRAAGHAAARP
jgi:hypothetical protein